MCRSVTQTSPTSVDSVRTPMIANTAGSPQPFTEQPAECSAESGPDDPDVAGQRGGADHQGPGRCRDRQGGAGCGQQPAQRRAGELIRRQLHGLEPTVGSVQDRCGNQLRQDGLRRGVVGRLGAADDERRSIEQLQAAGAGGEGDAQREDGPGDDRRGIREAQGNERQRDLQDPVGEVGQRGGGPQPTERFPQRFPATPPGEGRYRADTNACTQASTSSAEWAAESWTRIRAASRGTTGKLNAVT